MKTFIIIFILILMGLSIIKNNVYAENNYKKAAFDVQCQIAYQGGDNCQKDSVGNCWAFIPDAFILLKKPLYQIDEGLKKKVSFKVTSAMNKEKIRALTSKYLGKNMALIIDNKVYSAPMIRDEIRDGNISITFQDTRDLETLKEKLH